MHKFRFKSNAYLGLIKFPASWILETSDQNLIDFLSKQSKVERLTKPESKEEVKEELKEEKQIKISKKK